MTIAAPANSDNASNKETRLWVFMTSPPVSLFHFAQQSCIESVYGVMQEENEQSIAHITNVIVRPTFPCVACATAVVAKKVGQGPLEFYDRYRRRTREVMFKRRQTIS